MAIIVTRGYSTTSQSFKLLPTREIGKLVIFIFYIVRIRKKSFLGPGPLKSEFYNSFLPFFVVRRYSTTFQSFMLLPTREIGEFVSFKFYKSHIRKNNCLGPRPPMSVNCKFFYANFRRERLLNNFPKFHDSTYTENWRISDESVF